MAAPYHELPPLQHTIATPSASGAVPSAQENIITQGNAPRLQVLGANALFNSSSAVNCLPFEILTSIFRELRDRRRGLVAQPWTNVAAVCRFWRTVVVSTPQLWTDIRVSLRMSPMLFQAFLERSDPFPVSVSFASNTKLSLYLALMHAYLGRVRILRFDTARRSEADCVIDLLEKRMPALEKLSVMFNPFVEQGDDTADKCENEDEDTDDEEPERVDSLGLVPGQDEEEEVFEWRPTVENLPNLTELSLRGIVLGYGSALSSSLKRLELRDCVTLAATLAALNSVLRRLPRLEELIIHRYRCNDERQTPGPRVRLPKTLRNLALTDSFWYTVYILDTFYVPRTVDTVAITKRVEYGDLEDSLDAPLHKCLPANKATCLPILSKVDSVCVDLLRDDGSCSVVGWAGLRRIMIDSDALDEGPVRPEIGSDLLALFGNAPLEELVVSCVEEHAISGPSWGDVLRGFPLLQRLALISRRRTKYSWDPQDAFLKALRGGRSVPCPNLRELTLCSYVEGKDEEVLEAIQLCLDCRQTEGQRLAVLRLSLVYGTPDPDQEGRDLRERQARYQEVLSRFVDVVAFPTYDEAHFFEDSPDEAPHSSQV